MHRSILVIEDDKDIREALHDSLHMIGYRVQVASNGQEALDVLGRMEPPCLILLDLMMPIMDGWEFRAKQKNIPKIANIPVVVVSADGNAKLKASKMNAQDGLTKPIDFEALFDVAETY